jgi:citrate lyase subunit beta/citryl-CoA lyase
MLGSVDLSLELRLVPRSDGLELLAASSQLVADSAAAGIAPPVDGVHVAIGDLDGLAARAGFARSIGFAGKACIHPAQVAVVNEVFQPTSAELEQARAIVDEYERAVAAGTGVAQLEGRMIDLPVAERARQLLAEERQ